MLPVLAKVVEEESGVFRNVFSSLRAKGLEFPVVFCPSLWCPPPSPRKAKPRLLCLEEQGWVLDIGSEQLEERRQKAGLEEMAEEMRLLYVAVTRAKYRDSDALQDGNS